MYCGARHGWLTCALSLALVCLSNRNCLGQLPGIEWGAYFDAEAVIPSAYFLSDEELIDQIAVDTSGGGEYIYAVGRTSSINTDGSGNAWNIPACATDTLSLGNKAATAFLAKYDSTGTLLWTRFLGTPLPFPFFNSSFAYCLALDRINGQTVIYVGGEITNGAAAQFRASTCDSSCADVYDRDADDDDEGFVAKYDEHGTLLAWSYVGGSGVDSTMSMDAVLGIDVHPVTHDIYVTGYTESINFGAEGIPYYDNTLAGRGDFFVASFNACLQMTWFTYYGGVGIQTANKQNDGQERGHDIKVFHSDTTDFLIVTGTVESSNLAVNANYDGTYGGTTTVSEDAFIMRWDFESLTSGPAWANYLGAGPADRGRSLDFDPQGNIYWTGWTLSNGLAFPADCSANLAQPAKSGKEDAFIAKFDKNGYAQWITYYGGSGDEEDNGIRYYLPACPPALVIITGLTTSGNLPHIPESYPHSTLNGGTSTKYDDVFIAAVEDREVCSEAQAITFSTYLGGKSDEHNHSTLSYGANLDMGNSLYLSYSTKSKSSDMLDNAASIKGTYNKGCCGGLSNTDGFIQKFYPFDLCQNEKADRAANLSAERISVYPTLTDGILHCRIMADKSGAAVLKVIDAYQKVHSEQQLAVDPGTNWFSFHLGNSSPGIYFVLISDVNGMVMKKIVKQ
jgi:hypothetical protein